MKSIKDWLRVLLLLSDEAAVVGLALLVLWWLGIEISLPVTIVAALLFGALVFVMHWAVMSTLRRKRVTGAEAMIGLVGKVIEPLTPVGLIKVCDEYWKAKSVDGEIMAGEDVEILGLNGLTLKVRRRSC